MPDLGDEAGQKAIEYLKQLFFQFGIPLGKWGANKSARLAMWGGPKLAMAPYKAGKKAFQMANAGIKESIVYPDPETALMYRYAIAKHAKSYMPTKALSNHHVSAKNIVAAGNTLYVTTELKKRLENDKLNAKIDAEVEKLKASPALWQNIQEEMRKDEGHYHDSVVQFATRDEAIAYCHASNREISLKVKGQKNYRNAFVLGNSVVYTQAGIDAVQKNSLNKKISERAQDILDSPDRLNRYRQELNDMVDPENFEKQYIYQADKIFCETHGQPVKDIKDINVKDYVFDEHDFAELNNQKKIPIHAEKEETLSAWSKTKVEETINTDPNLSENVAEVEMFNFEGKDENEYQKQRFYDKNAEILEEKTYQIKKQKSTEDKKNKAKLKNKTKKNSQRINHDSLKSNKKAAESFEKRSGARVKDKTLK